MNAYERYKNMVKQMFRSHESPEDIMRKMKAYDSAYNDTPWADSSWEEAKRYDAYQAKMQELYEQLKNANEAASGWENVSDVLNKGGKGAWTGLQNNYMMKNLGILTPQSFGTDIDRKYNHDGTSSSIAGNEAWNKYANQQNWLDTGAMLLGGALRGGLSQAGGAIGALTGIPGFKALGSLTGLGLGWGAEKLSNKFIQKAKTWRAQGQMDQAIENRERQINDPLDAAASNVLDREDPLHEVSVGPGYSMYPRLRPKRTWRKKGDFSQYA